MIENLIEIINSMRTFKGLDSIKVLKPSDKLRDDLGLDSFDLAELTVRIEEKFDVDVFEDGLVNTIEEIIVKLEKHNG